MRCKVKYPNSRIGIDILCLSRFEVLVLKYGAERISQRICSLEEIGRLKCLSLKNKIGYLANVFSTKEALYKALSFTGLKRNWKQVSLLKSSNGAPFLKFARVPNQRWTCSISISHDSGFLISTVFLQKS